MEKYTFIGRHWFRGKILSPEVFYGKEHICVRMNFIESQRLCFFIARTSLGGNSLMEYLGNKILRLNNFFFLVQSCIDRDLSKVMVDLQISSRA